MRLLAHANESMTRHKEEIMDMEQSRPATILVVDDDENNRKLLEALLAAEGHAVRSATSGENALAAVAEQLPDLILLDIMLPGIDGFEVMRRLKADSRNRFIPIILVTALEDRESRLKGLEMGAEEFLSKPVERAELLIRVRNLLKVKEHQDFLASHNATLEEHVQWLANFDVLTGLPNRALLTYRINFALNMAQRSHAQLAVMFLDLDHFKNVNDTLGHHIGDELLKEVAKRLKSAVREQDTVSRLGGDEFILVLPDTDADGAARVAEKLLKVIAQPCQIEQYEQVITPSIGIVMYPGDGEDVESLFKCADVAMYRAKHDGRNSYQFFTQEMQTHSARTLQLDNALRRALERDQLRLHYQPQVSLQDGRIIGAEALLRWQHPELGAVSPAEFIPIAESSGQILPIGEWVLRSAVHQLKVWMDSGLEPMTMAVNLSAVQFRHPHLPELVTQILEEAKLPPQYLELELTEGVAMDAPLRAMAVMDNLHQRGIRMSIDDFGTGYSSLSHLKRFQVYKLKIDQSFVSNITEDPEDQTIVVAIISLAGCLGLQTIAEGVETEEQLAFLREQGCNEVQGYYFSKPLPAAEFERLLREGYHNFDPRAGAVSSDIPQ